LPPPGDKNARLGKTSVHFLQKVVLAIAPSDVGFCVAAGGKSSPLVVGHEKSLMEFAKKVHPSALTFRVERFKDARQSISPSPATEQQPGGTAEQALG
ncbi:hypothetical protein DYB37_012623, partial [Aphanomyces astaci]